MLKNRISGIRRRLKATALAAMTIAGAAGIFSGTVCYAVKIGGETVGAAKSVYTIREAVDKTERLLYRALGHAYYIDPEITAVFASATLDESQLEAEIIESLPDVNEAWGITVDGELVGACSSRDAAEAIVQEKLDMFVTENTTSVFMIQDVSIDPILTDDTVLQDEKEISRLLDPNNDASDYALKILVTEQAQEARLIPYETEYTYTADMYDDTEERTVKGFDGAEYATMEIQYLNGNEVLRTDLEVQVVTEPITEEITKGTTPRPRTASYGEYIWPVQGHVTSTFGPRHISISSSFHKGIDIATDYGTPIAAADGGEVIYAEWMGGYGNLVQIRHDNGDVTYYAHCSSIAVSVGQRVARGETISYVGSTGNSTGNHCHFEIRVNDEPQNPYNYLP